MNSKSAPLDLIRGWLPIRRARARGDESESADRVIFDAIDAFGRLLRN